MWTKSSRDNFLAALLHSGPINPQHDRPASLTGDRSPNFGSDAEERFFADFDMFANQINNLYTASNGWEGGPWRLQELANTEMSLSNYDDPTFGRRYTIFYNHAAIGLIEICGILYDLESARVSTDIELEHVRLLPFEEVAGFLVTLSQYLAWGKPEEFAVTQRSIDRALIAVVWSRNRDVDEDGRITLRLTGSSQNYLNWKKQVLSNRARGA
jgi:hypothetical protein